MALNRYLLYISYMGKSFIGAQRQVSGAFPRVDDPNTIQGRLEMGLKLLNPCNEAVVKLSSRTDAGVHALCSTVHVDLYRRNGLEYEPRTITLCLNKFFKKEDVPIRVLKTYLVPPDFHCRHMATSRTYLYRLATVEEEALNLAPNLALLPIEEVERCLFLCTNYFEAEQMRESAKLFLGRHDFRTFMGRGSHDPNKMTRRNISRVDILENNPLTYSTFSYPSVSDNRPSDYKFYNIYVEANGFLYRQVRRIVSTLIAAAQGKVSRSDIKLMLEVPSHRSWNEKIKTVPAYGLYLCNVDYSEKDKASFRDSLEGGQ